MTLTEEVRAAMKRAYHLGQTYWQQADSDFVREHKKADVTAGRFTEATDEICAKVDSFVASAEQASKQVPSRLDIMSLIREQCHRQYIAGATNDQPDGKYLAEIEAAICSLAGQPAAPLDFRNVKAVSRSSDQGLHLGFTSARAASQFEREAKELAGQSPAPVTAEPVASIDTPEGERNGQ